MVQRRAIKSYPPIWKQDELKETKPLKGNKGPENVAS